MADVGKVDGVAIDDIGKINLMTLAGGALAEDFVDSAITTLNADTADGAQVEVLTIGPVAGTDVATITKTFDANSMAVAVGYIFARRTGGDMKLRLYMDGVQMAESGIFDLSTRKNYIVVGTKALSGSKICKITAWNSHATITGDVHISAMHAAQKVACGIGVGSIKLT